MDLELSQERYNVTIVGGRPDSKEKSNSLADVET